MRGPVVNTSDNLRSTKDGVTWFDNGTKVSTRSKVNLVNISITDDPTTKTVTITGVAQTDAWDGQDFLPKSQWGRRGMLGSAATQLFLEGILDNGGAPALVGSSSSRVIAATGAWGRSTVSAAAAAATEFGVPAFTVTDGAAQRALLPVWHNRMRTGTAATAIAGARFWYGLSNVTSGVSSPQAGVNINTLEAAGFRFFPTVGDANWQAVSGNAATVAGQTTDTGVVVAAGNTIYEFILDMSVAGTIDYYINGVLVHSESTVLPDNVTDLGIVSTGRQVTTGTARSVDWMGDTIRYTVNL